jgi:5-(carboxyamino)imidazole ribonucleotide synthase
MNYFSSDFKLGIVGGGQLGKMLLQETRKWDTYTKVLDSSKLAPSRIASNEFEAGDLMDFETVYQFGKGLDLVTIEIEHINIEALKKLESEGVKVYPKPSSLEIIVDKAEQKEFYSKNSLPTSDFKVYCCLEELQSAVSEHKQSLPFVWKSAQFGYDGQGVKVVRSAEDLKDLAADKCIAEALVPFEKELAVIVARTPEGITTSYPLVEMEFHPQANQVEYVLCPAQIDESIDSKARAIAMEVAEKLDIVGLLAVELFMTASGEILINEVAPRPHNSGHYTIEASITSQYEQHLRAILNLPLGSTDSVLSAVMVNLVGEEGYQGDVIYENMEAILNEKGVNPHIYGKRETRPFRKMGHVTIVDQDLKKAREKAAWVKKTIRVISTTKK